MLAFSVDRLLVDARRQGDAAREGAQVTLQSSLFRLSLPFPFPAHGEDAILELDRDLRWWDTWYVEGENEFVVCLPGVHPRRPARRRRSITMKTTRSVFISSAPPVMT
jgi:hypothetical protein